MTGRNARSTFGAVALALAVSVVVACGDDDGGTGTERPAVVDVTAKDNAIQIPSSLEAGFTTFHIDGQSDLDNHLLFLRAEGIDATQLDELIVANSDDEEEGPPPYTLVGGNGAMAKGDQVDVTFELKSGVYGVVMFDDEGEVAAHSIFEVEDGATNTAAPKSDGVITLGPGMAFTLPDGFNGRGTFEVKNADGEAHEGAFVRLADGKTTDDLRAWADAGFEAEPPFVSAGGFGALDAGLTGWVTSDLEPGNYAILCWLPGSDGSPHWTRGMLAAFSVR